MASYSLHVYVVIAVLCVAAGLGECTKGVDVSTSVSTSDLGCLKNDGYESIIVRAYRSLGSPDPDAVKTLANAQSAGIKYTDVYLFPCPKCSKSAALQVDEMGMYVTRIA